MMLGTTGGSGTEGTDINLEIILIRIKEKMGTCVRDINELFYNRETGENDSKLCVLMGKVLRLVSYLESTNEGNVLGRVAVDLKE
jgi:hypothetical protein